MTKTTKPKLEGYAGHKPGSRKGKVHQLFDEQGPEAAIVLGRRLKLEDTTVRAWISLWRRTGKKKPAAKKAKAAPAAPMTMPETPVESPAPLVAQPDQTEAVAAALQQA